MNPDMTEYHHPQQDATAYRSLMDQTTRAGLSPADSELGAILQHQLDASLLNDIGFLFANAQQELAGFEHSTFHDLLFHPHPSARALRLAKDFAKQLYRQSQHAYPEDVATVLYYACIAAAELRAGTSISDLPRPEIETGCQWARDLPWMPENLQHLFAEALASGSPGNP